MQCASILSCPLSLIDYSIARGSEGKREVGDISGDMISITCPVKVLSLRQEKYRNLVGHLFVYDTKYAKR